MRTAALFVALPIFLTTPAMSQPMDHNMPGMSGMPSMPASKPEAKPAVKPAAKPISPTAARKSSARHRMHALKNAPARSSIDESHGAMPGMVMPPDSDAAPATKDAMAGMEGMEESVGQEPPPPTPTDRAADKFYDPKEMAASEDQLRMEHGGSTVSKVMMNLGEYQFRDGETGYRWEGEAWIGGDVDRLVVKSEGDGGVKSGVAAAEIQGLYSRAIGPYFDLQAGVRHDFKPKAARTYATVGIEGLAPYLFETQAALFLSDHGEVLGRLEGTYDFRLTQRWIVQPRAEINIAAQDIPETGIGSGISNVELGARLRYEVRREFAPYIGISFDEKLGDTANLARLRGEDTHQTSLVVGVRAWF